MRKDYELPPTIPDSTIAYLTTRRFRGLEIDFGVTRFKGKIYPVAEVNKFRENSRGGEWVTLTRVTLIVWHYDDVYFLGTCNKCKLSPACKEFITERLLQIYGDLIDWNGR